MPRYFLLTLIVCSLVLVGTGCGGSATATPEPAYKEVTVGTLKPGQPIPEPKGEVVLTVSGKIGAPNRGDQIVMDMATLESVGEVEYALEDPFEKKPATFRGPLMSVLLDLWKVPTEATVLEVVALNDYRVNVPIGDLRQYPVIFAIRTNGEYMPIEVRGPAMLVYPYHRYTFNHEVYNDYWAWQIASITVK